MIKKLRSFLLFLFVAGCIEPYEFVVHDDDKTLVIEAFISDKSFNETLLYPSDGRYFKVRLTTTGDVRNTRPEPVNGAVVQLLSSAGAVWIYTEKGKGIYELLDTDFSAELGTEYKLRIALSDETLYESKWETMPMAAAPPMGAIGFTETEKMVYVMEASEWQIRSIKGISANIHVAQNNTGATINYRWTYSPTWIYKAPLSSVIDPGHICWATDDHYLNSYGLHIDRTGGYHKDLFFLRTIRNERIFEKFSVLITQHVMNDQYYNFWKEMKDQNEGSLLAGVPPYNLQSNFFSTSDDKRVSGFFGVVGEQAIRWYFSRKDLSYTVVNTLKGDCLVDYLGPPARECTDCMGYSFGTPTTTKPAWWQ